MDDNLLKRDIKKNMNDPFLNLSRFGDNTIEEGFCSSSVIELKEGNEVSNNNSGNIVHQSIIKRFNQHSFLVLKTCNEQPPPPPPPPQQPSNGSESVETTNTAPPEKSKKRKSGQDNVVEEYFEEETPEVSQIKKQKIIEKIHYEDLSQNDLHNRDESNANGLNLEKLEKHLFGCKKMVESKATVIRNHEKRPAIEFADHSIRNISNDWNQRITHRQLINPTMAVNALGELSPGGILMRGYHNLSNFVSPEIEREISHLYLSAAELLKEFWSAFPPINAELENKAIKMHDTLQRFNSSKLKAFEERISRDLSPLSSQMLLHLNLLMNTAFKKFQRRIKNKDSKY